jgi:hypothetical protein
LGDEALYIMGLIYIHPGNHDQDYGTSLKLFQRLKHEFPESLLRDDAEVWIVVIQTVADKNEEIGTLHDELVQAKKRIKEKNRRTRVLESEVEDLKGQIERLKKVDLGIDEKKRGVSPSSRGKDGEED